MSKIYFSRSISRTMSADHPVGDPTGGAAYGEKNDPISAVLSIATMAGTYATAGTFAAMTVMQGITFAGAAMSLVGNVTGNKTLSKIGMVAGIAGGLGSLAEAKGWISKTPTLGETFGNTGSNAANAMASKSGSLSQSQAAGNVSQADAAARNAEMIDASKNTTAARTNLTGSPDGMVKGAAGMSNQPSNAAFNQGSRIAPTPAADVADEFAGGFKEVANPAGAGQTGKDWRYFTDAGGQSAAISPEGKYFLNGEQVTGAAGGKFGFGDYANMAWEATKQVGSAINPITNPYGAMAVGQIAQPISDYLSGKTDAEIDALEAQTGYADAKALQMQEEIATEKRRRANLNAGYGQVNTGITVNPNAYTAQQGLIAQQMQQA